MHVAFAMTGNRVEKTLRKAGLRKFIGEQWFFPTVEEGGTKHPVERITCSGPQQKMTLRDVFGTKEMWVHPKNLMDPWNIWVHIYMTM